MAFLIVGAVQLIGFTSSGIAAGSTAAAMMSAAGPVAAGSAVAIMQSIGATRAVSATTAFIANGALGAAIGAGAYGVINKFRGGGGDDGNNDDHNGGDPPDGNDSNGGDSSNGDDTPNSKDKGKIESAEDKKKPAETVIDNHNRVTSAETGSTGEPVTDSSSDSDTLVDERRGHSQALDDSDPSHDDSGVGSEGDSRHGAVVSAAGENVTNELENQDDPDGESAVILHNGKKNIKIKVADFGEPVLDSDGGPVYDSNGELYDPGTGDAVVEI